MMNARNKAAWCHLRAVAQTDDTLRAEWEALSIEWNLLASRIGHVIAPEQDQDLEFVDREPPYPP